MKKTLSKHGNSLALVIDKPILELLGIDSETELTIATDGRSLVVTPADVHDDRDAIDAALRAVNERHGATLKRLAE
jgi:antitoxin component of MazEF toxin-antitoxin module